MSAGQVRHCFIFIIIVSLEYFRIAARYIVWIQHVSTVLRKRAKREMSTQPLKQRNYLGVINLYILLCFECRFQSQLYSEAQMVHQQGWLLSIRSVLPLGMDTALVLRLVHCKLMDITNYKLKTCLVCI